MLASLLPRPRCSYVCAHPKDLFQQHAQILTNAIHQDCRYQRRPAAAPRRVAPTLHHVQRSEATSEESRWKAKTMASSRNSLSQHSPQMAVFFTTVRLQNDKPRGWAWRRWCQVHSLFEMPYQLKTVKTSFKPANSFNLESTAQGRTITVHCRYWFRTMRPGAWQMR